MPTTSIHLTDEELAELDQLRAVTGEPAAVLLKRAARRGVKDLRLEQGLLASVRGADSTTAATIAGLPRATFLAALADHAVPMLTGPSTLATELESLATCRPPG